MALKVFIYGSCVTRDAVEFWDPDDLILVDYIARQSLISAMTAPGVINKWRLSEISSSFQRRMLKGDIESSLTQILAEKVHDYDVILWDLTDERHGIQYTNEGGVVTRLRNFEKEKLYKGNLGSILRATDPSYIELWTKSLDNFLCFLDKIGARARLILNDTKWAKADNEGVKFTGEELFLNPVLKEMVSRAAARGVKVIQPAESTLLARVNHKWGRAPFHYIESTYRSMTASLLEYMHREER